jgi:hypothetical protein
VGGRSFSLTIGTKERGGRTVKMRLGKDLTAALPAYLLIIIIRITVMNNIESNAQHNHCIKLSVLLLYIYIYIYIYFFFTR